MRDMRSNTINFPRNDAGNQDFDSATEVGASGGDRPFEEIFNVNQTARQRELERKAGYSGILSLSLLAMIILVEGLINAYFFSKASDLGLLGGWIQAIVIAATNVGFAFLVIGWASARGFYTGLKLFLGGTRFMIFGPFLMVGSALLAVAGIVASGFLNYSAALYRDMLELNQAELAVGGADVTGSVMDPVSRALAGQIPVTLDALALGLIGVAFAMFAAWKGASTGSAIIGLDTYGEQVAETEDKPPFDRSNR